MSDTRASDSHPSESSRTGEDPSPGPGGIQEATRNPAQDVAQGAAQDAARDASEDAQQDGRAGRLSEATTVGRAQDGEIAAFETLVQRYSNPVFRLALRMLSDRGEAEDVVQDTFIVVWRRLPTLADPALFRAWVYRIATRHCLHVLRARARRPDIPTERADLEAAAEATSGRGGVDDDPAASAQHAMELAGLSTVLNALTDEQRICWVLREMNELTYPEVAFATGLPVSTVRGRIARARQNLMKGMDSWR